MFKTSVGSAITLPPENLGGDIHIAFHVAAVNDEGQATELKIHPKAPFTLSEGLNHAAQLTGAVSVWAGEECGTIHLSHGRRTDSPYYSEERAFAGTNLG